VDKVFQEVQKELQVMIQQVEVEELLQQVILQVFNQILQLVKVEMV
jgi:hypothetical protein